MKMKITSIGMVLLLTIGVITAVSFSLGCTEQEEAPVEPSDNTSVEPAETIPAEPTENASAEPAETTPAGPAENTPVESAETIPAGSSESFTEELEPISADDITNIEWQWTGFQDSDSPETRITVPDPENYTLAFFADGTYYIKADCNSGSGTYTLDGNNLTLGPTTITLMACGPDSMDGEYLSLLPSVGEAALEDGQLVLYPGPEGDKMFFVNGGEAEQ
jgi:heat shock protein HslJ